MFLPLPFLLKNRAMTIQLELGLERPHFLPILSKKAVSIYQQPDKSISVMELVDINGLDLHYTSLRDLILPKDLPKKGKMELSDLSHVTFKDPLVKQAARAYLQPMLFENREEPFVIRYWQKFNNENSFISMIESFLWSPFQACINFFGNHVYLKLSQAFVALIEQLWPQIFRFLHLRPLE